VRIEGSTVLVTGASSGIGAATARALARRQASLVLLARTRAALEAVGADVVARGGRARAYAVDLAEAAAVERVARTISREVGTPDVLINCAGSGRWLFVEETAPAEAVRLMAAPYFAAFFVTRAFLPAMLERGSGHIVNVGSPGGRMVWPGATAYIAARWALHGFTAALRADLRGSGLRVTLVVPGKVQSSYFAHNPGAEARIPRLARLAPTLTPEQVAEAVVRGLERDQQEVVLPFTFRLLFALQAHFPRVVTWATCASGYRRPASPLA
jgi:short-subunit dehydrogenase